MNIKKNILLEGKHQKPKPILIFCHGYKGYKDWGAWNQMATKFTDEGFFFIKFNFSYNGGSVEQPIDFPDLDAFGNNNFIKELDDLETVTDWITTSKKYKKELDTQQLFLIGHSRGGGIVSIKAEEDFRIKKIISLAGVSDYKNRFPTKEILQNWQKKGVQYVLNKRTKQQMPHFYQFYTNFIENEKRLTIQRAITNLKIPLLIIQGNEDSTVSVSEAKNLHQWCSKSELAIIDGANHVFGIQHPWKENQLSAELEKATAISIQFLKKL